MNRATRRYFACSALSTVAFGLSAVGTAAPACPGTLAAWTTYRATLAKALARTGGLDDGRTSLAFIKGCLAQMTESAVQAKAAACMLPVTDYLADEAVPNSSLGFSVSDSDYYAMTSQYTQFPADLATNAFLSLISTWDKTAAVGAYIDGLNVSRAKLGLPPITWLTYQTALTTPDAAQTSGRLLVVVPDPSQNRTFWAQFGLTPPGSAAFSSHIFAIVVAGAKGATQSYFHRFQKDVAADGTLSIGPSTDPTPLDACGGCHKSQGPLVIGSDQVDSTFLDTNSRLTQTILGYGVLTSPYDLTPKRGPGMGAAVPRTQAFVEACAASAIDDIAPEHKDEVTQRILGAMSCGSCHDGVYRGLLSMPLNSVVVDHFYWSGLMPPGSAQTLSPLERSALMDCLSLEFFGVDPGFEGVLTDYLTGVACQ